MTAFSRPALSRFLILYAALYAGFGVQSPYLPSLLESRDLRPEAMALVLAAGSAVRLVAGPGAGRLGDRVDAPKVILSLCSAVAALIALGYLPARGLWLLFAVGVFRRPWPRSRRSATRSLSGPQLRPGPTTRLGEAAGMAGCVAPALRRLFLDRCCIFGLPRSSGSMAPPSPPRLSRLYWCRSCRRRKMRHEPLRRKAGSA